MEADVVARSAAEIGVEVIIFRGADRNRRRGFHNLTVFSERLRRELDRADARS